MNGDRRFKSWPLIPLDSEAERLEWREKKAIHDESEPYDLHEDEPRNHDEGFTILELLCVIAIMALIAALSVPAIKAISVSQMRYTVMPKELVQEINLARQKAIATRLDTYVLFDLYTFDSNFTNAGIVYSTNIQPCQSWCVVQYGRCGDQIGRHSWHQCSNWQSLPSGTFISPFTLLDNQTPYALARWSKDYAKPLNSLMPLPHVTIGFESMPCVAFKGGSGALMNGCPEYIVLMTGQHYWQPDGTSTNSAYTVIEIDQAGRASIEQERVR